MHSPYNATVITYVGNVSPLQYNVGLCYQSAWVETHSRNRMN